MKNNDRLKYDQYVANINKMLNSEDFYNAFQKKLRASKPMVKLCQKHRNKLFDLDWIETIDSTLPNLDNIVRNPRKFIVIEEDIVDISLARAISTESVKHLAQHTNMIASVDKDGNVTPNKILNTTKEESYEIYENRFIYTLLKNVSNFVTRRMDAIKASYVNDHILELDVDASIFTGKTRVFYKLELIGSLPMEELKKTKNEDLSIIERIAKMQRIIAEFMGSPFAKQMVNSAPVRPPITRTNVILKNPDFKKALVLWQFIESYQKMGFTVENEVKPVSLDSELSTGVNDMVYLGAMLMQGLIDGNVEDFAFFRESNMDEKDLVSGAEQKDDTQEDTKTEETPADNQTPQEQPQEEAPQETLEEPKVEDEEEHQSDQNNNTDDDQDDTIEDSMPILENRSVFQRNNEESSLSKSEILRINKAIDRVIIREKTLKSNDIINETIAQAQSSNIDKEALAHKLEREKENIRKALERKAKIAEKEKQAMEKALEQEKTRLAQIEKELASALTETSQQEPPTSETIDTP